MALCSFVWLYLVIGAVAFNGKEAYPKDPTDEKSDFSCDEKGYLEYLSKWGDAKGTSRDVKSEEFKKRLEYFKQSCKTIHRGSGKRRYKLEFTFYADWHPEEFEEITASVVRYKGVQPETEVIPIMNNTNYRYLMPSMDPCDGNAELRELISKPQNCSVSWAFAITNSIEYAIMKMYFEHYDQIVDVSLSAQELIDCVGDNGEDSDGEYDEKKGGCAGFSLATGFDYVSLYGIAYSESYPHRNEKGECRRKEIGEEHRYHIAGYEKPVTYNKLGLFDLMKRGPVAVTMGLDPQYFQYYRNDRDGEFYFNSSSNQPSVYGVVVEYSQFAVDGKDELAKYPYFAVETRLRACNSMVFRLPILDTVENANVGGIAGLAIRPIVSELLPTPEPPTSEPITSLLLTSCSQLDSLPSQLPSVTQLILSSEFDCDGTVDLKRFENCESIEVESNAMKRATRVDLSGMESLERMDIGSASCSSLTDVIVGSTVFSFFTNVTIGANSLNSLTSLPSSLTSSIIHLDVGSNSLRGLGTFSLTSLHSLSVGSNSLTSVRELELDESSELESSSIDDGSFSGVETLILGNSTSQLRRLRDHRSRGHGWKPFGLEPHESGYSFHLDKKSLLRNVKKIDVRDNGFHDIHHFRLVGLVRLEVVVIGRNSIHGREGQGAFVIESCTSIHKVSIGEGSFTHYHSLSLKHCGHLREFRRDKKSFPSLRSIEMRSIGLVSFEIGHSEFTHLESLVMDGLSGLKRLRIGKGNGVKDIENGRFEITNCGMMSSLVIEEGSFKFFGEVRIEKNVGLREMEFGPWCFNRAHDVRFIGRNEGWI